MCVCVCVCVCVCGVRVRVSLERVPQSLASARGSSHSRPGGARSSPRHTPSAAAPRRLRRSGPGMERQKGEWEGKERREGGRGWDWCWCWGRGVEGWVEGLGLVLGVA